LNSFSLAAQDKKLEDVRGVFFEIVKKDVTKQLKQAPHMGYLWCCYKLNNTQDIEAFIEEISFSHGLQDLNDGPWFPILVEFEKIYNLIFEGIGNIIKNNRKVKLYWEALEAFYLYSSFEEYELVRFSKKHLTALKRYLKTDLTNVHVACAIFNMQKHYNMFFDAYKTYAAMNNGYMDLSGKHIDGIDFLAECTPDVVESIYQDVFQSFLDDSVSNKGAFTSGVFDCLVKCLYESKSNNRYIKITQLADKLDKYYLIKSECLFEIAYSYAQLNDISDKAEYYYLQVLEKEYKNSPVLNNLGVICEHRKEYQKAYEYFQKAHEIDGQKESHKNNLNRLEKLIQANKKIRGCPR
jgi:tetratricopeptide (TPR) repeat protein